MIDLICVIRIVYKNVLRNVEKKKSNFEKKKRDAMPTNSLNIIMCMRKRKISSYSVLLFNAYYHKNQN